MICLLSRGNFVLNFAERADIETPRSNTRLIRKLIGSRTTHVYEPKRWKYVRRAGGPMRKGRSRAYS